MALISVNLKLVRPYGSEDNPVPANGKVIFMPVAHGKYEDSLRSVEKVTADVENGVMDTVELTPALWNVTILPVMGNPWPTMSFTLFDGMPEPVNLATLLPEIVVDGVGLVKGDPGPSIADWEDNGDGTITFIMDDGKRVGPGVIPAGPPGVGIEDISDPDAVGMMTVTFTDGSTTQVKALEGQPSKVPGPANKLTVGSVTKSTTASATITGNSPNQVLNLGLPKGDKGEDGYVPVVVSDTAPDNTQVVWVNPDEDSDTSTPARDTGSRDMSVEWSGHDDDATWGFVKLRRVDNIVTLDYAIVANESLLTPTYTIPYGFSQPEGSTISVIPQFNTSTFKMSSVPSMIQTGNLLLPQTDATEGLVYGSTMWLTLDEWPEELPGI